VSAYESHWSGEFRITPPLTWAEIKRGPGVQDVRLRLDEQVEDTPTGQVRTVTAVAVEPGTREAFSGYAVEEELQQVIDAHPQHVFAGVIVARPLDPDGIPWRYVVKDRIVVRQEPRLVWPDGVGVTE
jgi:Family of unknown function (DUF6205)